MWPSHWRQFVTQHGLVGKEIDFPESADQSGLGGPLEIFSEQAAILEAEEAYPGIGVRSAGFIPVAGCSTGSGDPYFININDPVPGPLYRIYHDCVFDENFDREAAVALVFASYEELLPFTGT